MTFGNYRYSGKNGTNAHLVESIIFGFRAHQGNAFGPSNSQYDSSKSIPSSTSTQTSFKKTGFLEPGESWIESAIAHIDTLKSFQTNGEYAPPNQIAIDNAKLVLDLLLEFSIKPTSIGPCPDEGVTFSLIQNGKMSAIETANSGEIVVVLAEKNGTPAVWEISNTKSDIQDAIQEIAFHFGI